MKAELDPAEAQKSTPTSASLKVLGVAFVLFCAGVAAAIIWEVVPANTESILKVAASFVLLAVAVVAILFLVRSKNK
jgi:cytochrome c biogenesis protein CcdA